MGEFHAKDGLTFERVGDTVRIRCGDMAPVVLDAHTWASVVASMSLNGETIDSFYVAMRNFRGYA